MRAGTYVDTTFNRSLYFSTASTKNPLIFWIVAILQNK